VGYDEYVTAMVTTGDKGFCKDCSFASATKVRGTGEHLWYCYNLDVLRPIDVLDNGDPSGCHGGFLQKPECIENVVSINGNSFVLYEASLEYDLGLNLHADRPRIWKLDK